MADVDQHNSVGALVFEDLRLERYRHGPRPTAPIPAHVHEEYQFGLSLDCAGEYRCRGARHVVPAGALRIIQPGEVHASRDLVNGPGATTLLLYVPPRMLREVAVTSAGAAGERRQAADPFFASPVVRDRELAGHLLNLCRALGDRSTPRLERDAVLLATLARFVFRHAAAEIVPRPAGQEPNAVAVVKAYLEEHPTENVSLARLSEIVGLSPPYLDRVFARSVGVPPHRYQVQVRVERAKTLLAAGRPIKVVASETGFADQSHLGRHFRRWVGVTPGRYRAERAGQLVERDAS